LPSVSAAPWLGYHTWRRVFVNCRYRTTKRHAL